MLKPVAQRLVQVREAAAAFNPKAHAAQGKFDSEFAWGDMRVESSQWREMSPKGPVFLISTGSLVDPEYDCRRGYSHSLD